MLWLLRFDIAVSSYIHFVFTITVWAVSMKLIHKNNKLSQKCKIAWLHYVSYNDFIICKNEGESKFE